MSNQLLDRSKKGVVAKVAPQLRRVVQKLVTAGEQVMYTTEMGAENFKTLGQAPNPEHIGAAAAKLAGILFNQSKKTAPPEALMPAAAILMFEGLQFMEDGGAVKVDARLLAECTKALESNLLQLLGVTPEKLQGMVDKSQPQGPRPAAQPAGPIVAGAQGAAQ